MRNFFKISAPIVIILALIIFKHPLLIKVFVGSARTIGSAINVTVYVNGVIQENIKIFHSDKYWDRSDADYFIVYISPSGSNPKQIFSLNRKDDYAGIAAASGNDQYDIIGGILFQGEVGAKFIPFEDAIKGFDFDASLKFTNDDITFNLPNKNTSPDLVKIHLN